MNEEQEAFTLTTDIGRIKQRIGELTRLILRYNEAYYNEGLSLISDTEYDTLFKELHSLETTYPMFRLPNTPTSKVGAAPVETSGRSTVAHKRPMLSLNNTYSQEELNNFETRNNKLLQGAKFAAVPDEIEDEQLSIEAQLYPEMKTDVEYVVEGKYDGIATSLHYEKGQLKRALQRGDGVRGEDITDNIRSFQVIPEQVEPLFVVYRNGQDAVIAEINDFEIRGIPVRGLIDLYSGEMMLSKKEFAAVNEDREKQFKNARNLVAGMLRLDVLSAKQTNKHSSFDLLGKANLNFIAYTFFLDKGQSKKVKWEEVSKLPPSRVVVFESPPSQYQNLKIMDKLGFTPDKQVTLCSSMTEVYNRLKQWEQLRPSFEFVMDGCVVKVNSLIQQAILGQVSRAPRWAVAFKFAAEQVKTKLLGITLQVGRTGKVTPVAELEPVDLQGSTIARATLHNFDYMIKQGITIGSMVAVEKGGDVIPKVSGRATANENLTEEEKKELKEKVLQCLRRDETGNVLCPCMYAAPLHKEPGKADYFCVAPDCPEQRINRITHFTSRKAMDIEGLSTATLNKLIEANLIENLADIYNLESHSDDILSMEGWGTTKLNNLLTAIRNSKSKPYEKVLYAIGIPHVGHETAVLLAEKFPSIDTLMNSTIEDLARVEGIGDVTAQTIFEFFQNEENRALIQQLKQADLQFKSVSPTSGTTSATTGAASNQRIVPTTRFTEKFQSKSVVITGSFFRYDRDMLKDTLKQIGAKVSTTVSARTNYLLTGTKPGGQKIDQASKYKITILDEDEIIKLLE